MGELIKNELKWIFGRSWPESWKNNPSFIRDHVYGFHWFEGGGIYNSFPSGHMTLAAAILSVLWMGYPRWRAAYGVMAGVAATGLVGSNFHFLGDVVAGGFLGATIGIASFKLFQSGWLSDLQD
jgi:membrane-associated phospholipid phosphatase